MVYDTKWSSDLQSPSITLKYIVEEHGWHATQAGLVGNRAIPSTGLWNVVLAMERAFPVLLSPGVDAVRSQEASSMGTVSKLWIQQVFQVLLLSENACQRIDV